MYLPLGVAFRARDVIRVFRALIYSADVARERNALFTSRAYQAQFSKFSNISPRERAREIPFRFTYGPLSRAFSRAPRSKKGLINAPESREPSLISPALSAANNRGRRRVRRDKAPRYIVEVWISRNNRHFLAANVSSITEGALRCTIYDSVTMPSGRFTSSGRIENVGRGAPRDNGRLNDGRREAPPSGPTKVRRDIKMRAI